MLRKKQVRLVMLSAIAIITSCASNPANFQRVAMSEVEAISYLQSEIAFQDENYDSDVGFCRIDEELGFLTSSLTLTSAYGLDEARQVLLPFQDARYEIHSYAKGAYWIWIQPEGSGLQATNCVITELSRTDKTARVISALEALGATPNNASLGYDWWSSPQ